MNKLKILLLILITCSVLTPLISFTLYNNLLNIKEKSQKNQNSNNYLNHHVKNLKNSEIWEDLRFIHITGANWSDTKEDYDWCTGSGFLNDPYIIKNININAGGSGSGILIENSNNVYFEITNCLVYNSGSGAIDDAAIKLYNTSNGKLINNDCSQNRNGIYLFKSDNNTIVGNAVNNNNEGTGIELRYSDDNHVSGNTGNNNENGIYLKDSNNNYISENNVDDNGMGLILFNSSNNIVLKNEASHNDFQGILIQNSEKNTIFGNTAYSNFQNGISLTSSNNNSISRNTVGMNLLRGIYLISSNNNTIWGNLIKYNKYFGIELTKGLSNLFYFNSIRQYIGLHAKDSGTNTQWDKMGIGNYWNNHKSPDSDNDGIVDTSYIIDDSKGIEDTFPLTESPIHEGERIHIDDSGVSSWNWSKTAKLKVWCSGSGTEDDPYVITNLIINIGYWISSILIQNSNVYFRIENCQIYNANSGIKLCKTTNGKIINNECLLNKKAIVLYQSNKNDISGNIVNNNIYGIYLIESNNNTILGNNVNNNKYGIGLVYNSDNNTISRNNANINEYGIALAYNSDNNTVFGNILNNNINGIALLESNNNTVSRNILVLNVFFIEEDECIENIIKDNRCYTAILPSGINEVKIEPYRVDDVDVGMEITLDQETEVIFSAFNDNNIEDAPLDNGLIFMNLQLNDTNNLNQDNDAPINFILEFDSNKYIPLEVFWFNEFANERQVAWEKIAFTDLGDGKIVISVNHTSIFAITGVILPIPSSSSNSDDDVYDFLFLFLIIFICSLTIVTAYSTYYYKARIQTRAKLTKKETFVRKPLVKSSDKQVYNSQNLKSFVENKNLLNILKKRNTLEKPDLFHDLDITAISDEFWEKLADLDLDDKEKRIFIIDMLTFTPEERLEIIDGMLELEESDSENTNQQEFIQGCF